MPGPTFVRNKIWFRFRRTNAWSHFLVGQMPGGQMPGVIFWSDKCQEDKYQESLFGRTNARRTNAWRQFFIGQMPGGQMPGRIFLFGQMPGGQMPGVIFWSDKCQEDKCQESLFGRTNARRTNASSH